MQKFAILALTLVAPGCIMPQLVNPHQLQGIHEMSTINTGRDLDIDHLGCMVYAEFTIKTDGNGPDFDWWIHSIDKVELYDDRGYVVRELEHYRDATILEYIENPEDERLDRDWIAEELAEMDLAAQDIAAEDKMARMRGEW